MKCPIRAIVRRRMTAARLCGNIAYAMIIFIDEASRTFGEAERAALLWGI